MKTTKTFLSDLWALTKPYWFSEERWVARGLLALIVALNLGLVYINVLINSWNNDFYNTLQNLDKEGFIHQIIKFSGLAFAFIVVAVYQLYLNQMLQIRWRRWLTTSFLNDWVAERAYYRLQLNTYGTDNPDQRIADDVSSFCDNTLSLSLGLLSSTVTLVSFVSILWVLSGSLSIPFIGVSIPGYMVWVALLYAIGGTVLSHWIGHPLINLNFNQQKYEANFRFSLIRFRENAESIALYKGEQDEVGSLKHQFSFVYDNWWAIMKRTKSLTWFRAGYNQIANIFPFVVAAPRFFAGQIKLGGLMQIASAFGQVQEASSWFVSAYTQLAGWKATVDRLITFHYAVLQAQAEAKANPALQLTSADSANYAVRNITLALPNGQVLLNNLNLNFTPKEHVLITGNSGTGKSTLFRTIAGIWPFASGEIEQPANSKVLFLPQKPYLSIGTLREQLTYPSPAGTFSEAALSDAMHRCGLEKFASRLDESQHWSQQLSGGEQQRIAFCRAYLQQPDWLFMDEASSALDEATESALYLMLQSKLPNTTMISIGHRQSLEKLHHKILNLSSLR